MKTIKLLAVCCLTMCLFASCGEKITVKGENGQEYESYQECCAVQDFMAAHTFLAKMEAKIDGDEIKKEEYETAKEYIFKQEALYLMSIGDDVAKKRISYLLKEEGGNDSHVAMLIDLAIDNDDEDFVKILVNQLKNPSGARIAKVATYLTKKDSGNNGYVITLINGISLKGTKPRPGIIGYYEAGLEDYMEFQKSVTSYNGICDKILDVAINNKNRDLALSILALYKEDIGMFTGGSSIKVKDNWYDKAPDGTLVDGNHRYIWFYNKSKTDAKKKYDEAVKSGAFNN